MRNEAPAQQVEGKVARLRMLPDDQQLLAWRTVEAWMNLVHAAVGNVDPFDDLKPERV